MSETQDRVARLSDLNNTLNGNKEFQVPIKIASFNSTKNITGTGKGRIFMSPYSASKPVTVIIDGVTLCTNGPFYNACGNGIWFEFNESFSITDNAANVTVDVVYY